MDFVTPALRTLENNWLLVRKDVVHIAHDWPNISKALMHTRCQNVEVTRRFGKKWLVPESGLKSQKMMYFVDEFPAQLIMM